MGSEREQANRLMLRARDAVDRHHRSELDIAALASIACVSEAHVIRTFKATFGETPHRYLQRRRIERAMYLLRTTTDDITGICAAVGFSSLGTFGRTFREIVGRRRRPTGLGGRCPRCRTASCRRGRDRAVSEKSPPQALRRVARMYTRISCSQLFVLDQDFGVRDPSGNAIRIGQMFAEVGS